jgi:ATP-dependent protease ClpP protease subunit
MKELQPFYRFTAEADTDEPASAQLDIYDAIGNFEEFGEVSAKGFSKALGELPKSVKRLDIHINSPGGSVYDAQAIYSRLADYHATKHVYIDGIAASAASIVAMVGHKVYMRANANMMIHLPMALTAGNKHDHEKSKRALQSIEDGMINAYIKKTGLARDEIERMLADETWMNAEQAVEHGFADEVRGVIKAAAVANTKRIIADGREFDLSPFKYHNVPAFNASTPTESNTMKTLKPKAAAEATSATEDPPAPTPTPPPQPAPKPKKPDGDEGEENGDGNGESNSGETAGAEYDRGVKAERDRVLALQALDRPATHAIIEAAIKEGKQVNEVYGECFSAMEKAGVQAARRADASVLDEVPPSEGGEAGAKTTDLGDRLTKSVKARLKQRGFNRFQRN